MLVKALLLPPARVCIGLRPKGSGTLFLTYEVLELVIFKADNELVCWAWHIPLARLLDHHYLLYALGNDVSFDVLVCQPCFPGAVLA